MLFFSSLCTPCSALAKTEQRCTCVALFCLWVSHNTNLLVLCMSLSHKSNQLSSVLLFIMSSISLSSRKFLLVFLQQDTSLHKSWWSVKSRRYDPHALSLSNMVFLLRVNSRNLSSGHCVLGVSGAALSNTTSLTWISFCPFCQTQHRWLEYLFALSVRHFWSPRC